MKKIAQAVMVAACLMGAGAAQAQLGGLGGLMNAAKGGGGGDISAEVNTFVTQSAALSQLTGRSVVAITLAFSDEQKRVQTKAELDAINKLTDTKEQKARMTKLVESESAEAKRLYESGEMKTRMATLDSASKKQVGDALLNYGIGALQAVALTRTGQSLVARASANPMALPQLVPVKDALPLLGKVVSDSGGFMAGVVKLAQGAKIDVPAVKADSKAVEITI
ncbi:hypothetical protein [Massilia yuzhufengensis]|uniref:Periplasmic chaperone for outer membrane proteins Skp n=1 Tax=Massilia yuzhufengensis TaxID=1164594 RepID=A0A1I1ES27_9BURK|nr:hypothetical protein [Massilia yuzhufengensis]SFB89939.1 hypothetical protein SAMN05216204_102225 [Massilia yuzhufengensis]